MIFPFDIKLEQVTNSDIGLKSEQKVFDIIENYIKSKSVTDFYRTGNQINFKQSFFVLNTNVFAIIDKGEFIVKFNNNKVNLIYKFYLIRFFIVSSLLAIGFGFVVGQLVFGLITFLLFVIGNFIICYNRQKSALNEIISEVNSLATPAT
ncbi:MAG TPA: hypothetical protein VNG53_01180 [Bacteroidia bacterium]|nr:hypothetical protein [Bacteroidia bacterium]